MTEVYSNGTGEFPAPGNGLVEEATPSEPKKRGNKKDSKLNTLTDPMKAWLWPEVKKYVTRDKDTGVYGLKDDMSREELADKLNSAFWEVYPLKEYGKTLTETNIKSALEANGWYTYREDMPPKAPKAPLRDSAATRIAALERAHAELVQDSDESFADIKILRAEINSIKVFLTRKYGESWYDPE